MNPFLDRYKKDAEIWETIFSEENYLKTIFEIEKDYLIQIGKIKYPNTRFSTIENLSFDYSAVKILEKEHKHDVVSVCAFLKNSIKKLNIINPNYVHFGLTSQDVVSLTYSLLCKKAYDIVQESIKKYVLEHKRVFTNKILMGFTHGQPATPIFGNNLSDVVSYNLSVAARLVPNKIECRFGGGACGDYFSAKITNNESFCKDIIEEFVVSKNIENIPHRQTDYYPYIRQILYFIIDSALFLKNEAKNMWEYCSREQLLLYNDEKQSGSSAMPHKINPIKFENAEGNFHLCHDLSISLLKKLLESRMDRDLSDLTCLRNIGMIFGYFSKGILELTNGLCSVVLIEPNFNKQPNIFSEAVNMSMVDEDENSYEESKKFFKNGNENTKIKNLVGKFQSKMAENGRK